MARRATKTKLATKPRRSANTPLANPRLLRRKQQLKTALQIVDLRLFQPHSPKRLRTIYGSSIQIASRPASPFIADRSGKIRKPLGTFAERSFIPKQTGVCIRRKTRREVLMAKSGGGGITVRKPRRRITQNSKLTCRR